LERPEPLRPRPSQDDGTRRDALNTQPVVDGNASLTDITGTAVDDMSGIVARYGRKLVLSCSHECITTAADVVPGRTYEIPVAAVAGETIAFSTSSRDFYDSILVLLAPDGPPVVGSDDANFYFAAFEYVAEETGTYVLQATSFESVSTGELVVTRR